MSIQELVRLHRRKWTEAGQWQDPNLTDCLDFMATEVAEAIDKRLRRSPARWLSTVASNRPSGSGARSPNPPGPGSRWNDDSAPPGVATKLPRLEMTARRPSGSGAGLP